MDYSLTNRWTNFIENTTMNPAVPKFVHKGTKPREILIPHFNSVFCLQSETFQSRPAVRRATGSNETTKQPQNSDSTRAENFPRSSRSCSADSFTGPRPNSMNAKSRGRVANPRPTYSLSGEFTQSRQERQGTGQRQKQLRQRSRERQRGWWHRAEGWASEREAGNAGKIKTERQMHSASGNWWYSSVADSPRKDKICSLTLKLANV